MFNQKYGMKSSFINQVAEILVQESSGDFKKTVVVFSNRRAKTFLSQALIEIHKENNFWLPAIFSTDDFIQHFTGHQQADNIQLQTILYQAYSKVLGNEVESFDEFAQWAAMMLNDFDEVDQHLVDADKIFNYLSEAKAIEIWNVDGGPLTKLQKSFLLFYQNLSPIYHQFKSLLKDNKLFYRGMIYKDLAEGLEFSDKLNQYEKIYFCGLNALLHSEKVIISKLLEKGIGRLIWDSDSYYLDNKQQEAGQFLRSNEKAFGKIERLKSNSIVDNEKKIEVVAAELQSGQVNFLAEYLRKQIANNRLNQTAVILADESISDAVLQALPEEIKEVNFTVGYSLSKSLFAQWVISIFNLKAHHEKNYELKIINFELIRNIFRNKIFEIIFNIPSYKIDQIIAQYIQYIKSNKSIEDFIVTKNKNIFDYLILQTSYNPLNDLNLIIQEKNKISSLLKEHDDNLLFVNEVFSSLDELNHILLSCNENFSYQFLSKAVQSKLNEVKIPFRGEPINQLQIMGILETRNLDFEDVIFLSTNEGILPESNFKKSFITNDIKAIFNLPTGIDREAVFSYHFYRLLQRSKHVTLVYNSTRTDEVSGEPSRYIMQLEQEWPLASSNLSKRNYKPDYIGNSDQIITVEKNEQHLSLIKNWASNVISFSSLNTYLRCSLQFYFKYIIKIKAVADEQEQSDDMDLGNIVHKTLEIIYKPFVNRFLDESLKDQLQNVNQLVDEVTKIDFPSKNFKTGTPYLLGVTAKHLVKKLIQYDLSQIAEGNKILIKGLEDRLSRNYVTKAGETVMISGTFDRIDYFNETPRILDYKTGHTDNVIKIRKIEDITDMKHDKQRQLLVYQWISNMPNAISGIVSLQNLTAGVKLLSNETIYSIDNLIQDFFDNTIEKAFDTNEYFVQTDNLDVCQYCDYNSICKRSED